jgi:hypothetical protein
VLPPSSGFSEDRGRKATQKTTNSLIRSECSVTGAVVSPNVVRGY